MKRFLSLCLKAGICLLFLAAAVVSLSLHRDRKEKANLVMSNLLTEFTMEEPSEMEISWKKNVTTLILKNNIWQVKERDGHAADTEKIIRFMEGLQKIRPLRRAIPADERVCSLLRVRPEETEPGKVPGVRIRVYGKEKKLLRDIVLGAGYFNETETVMPGKEPEPSGRWMGIVQKDGTIIPVLISSMFEEYTPVPGHWLSSPVFTDIKKLNRIEFESKIYPSWMVGRFSVRDKFESIIPGTSPVSMQKLNAMATLLSRRYVYEAVREKSAGKLTYIGKFDATDIDGFVRTLTFYKSDNTKGGILCKLNAYEKRDRSNKKRVDAFLNGRDGWLYVIPEQLFEKIITNPAGD